jgi:DNA invertase Pin-like site-specific DNA recombinase
MRAGIYARVSTAGQDPAGQLEQLRAHCAARGWSCREHVDRGLSGAKEQRPALESLLAEVRARRVDVVVCTKLDRLARSTYHLVTLGKELAALGVDLVVLDQAIDTTTPAGRLLFHMLAAIAEFERDLIRDRVIAGQARARARGVVFGRPPRSVDLAEVRRRREAGEKWRRIAQALKIPTRTLRRRAQAGQKSQVNCVPRGPLSTYPPGAADGRGTS